MKPFNLEKALAGEPVVTNDGRKVTNVRNNHLAFMSQYPLLADVTNADFNGDPQIRTLDFTNDGKFYLNPNRNSPLDLFMAE